MRTGKNVYWQNINSYIVAILINLTGNLSYNIGIVFPNNAIVGMQYFLAGHPNQTSPDWPLAKETNIFGGHEGLSVVWAAFLSLELLASIPVVFFAPIASDRLGRKLSLLLFFTLAAPGHAMQWMAYYSSSPWVLLYLGRFISCMFGQAGFIITPVLVNEISSPEVMGQLGTIQTVLVGFGSLLGTIAGMREVAGGSQTWHHGYLAAAILSILSVPVLLWARDSPAFLLSQEEKYFSAAESLVFYRGTSESIDDVAADAKTAVTTNDYFKFRALFRREHLLSTLLTVAIAASYVPVHFLNHFSNLAIIEAKVDVDIASYITVTLEAFGFLVIIICFFSVDRFGRRMMYLVSAWGSAVSLFGLAITQGLLESISIAEHSPLLKLFTGFLFALEMFLNIGIRALYAFLIPELFPLAFRSAGKSFAFLISSAASVLLIPYPLVSTNGYGPFNYAFMGFLVFAAAMFAQWQLPETSKIRAVTLLSKE